MRHTTLVILAIMAMFAGCGMMGSADTHDVKFSVTGNVDEVGLILYGGGEQNFQAIAVSLPWTDRVLDAKDGTQMYLEAWSGESDAMLTVTISVAGVERVTHTSHLPLVSWSL